MDLFHRAATCTVAALVALSNVNDARAWTGEDLNALSTTTSGALPSEQSASSRGCALSQPTLVETSSESCMTCHQRGSGSGHPVEVEYGQAHARSRGMMALRSQADVVKRGVFLSSGKITCLTCHDSRSPWENHLALPPGATPEPGVNPRNAETWRNPAQRAAQAARLQQLAHDGARPAVTPKPLCLACHAFD